MSNSLRVAVAIVFIAVMAVVNQVAHIVVGLGFVPWLLLMIGIFALGVKWENKEREADGRPSYSAYEAGQEMRGYLRSPTPYFLLALIAFCALIHWAESFAK